MPLPILGGTYDGVFELVNDLGDGRAIVFDVARKTVCTLTGLSKEVSPRFTAFGLRVDSCSTSVLDFVDCSRAFATPRPLTFCSDLVEMAAGAGSMGIAASFFGGSPRVCIDHNGLACSLLSHHSHGHVLQRDLLAPELPLELCHLLGTDCCTFVMGFLASLLGRRASCWGSLIRDHRCSGQGLKMLFWLMLRP